MGKSKCLFDLLVKWDCDGSKNVVSSKEIRKIDNKFYIGSRVEMWWEPDHKFYQGTVIDMTQLINRINV